MVAAGPTPPAPHPFALQLAETPRVVFDDGRTVALAPLDAVMLAWLALEGPTPRVRLAQLLWPERDVDTARNSLRQRVFQLRRQLGVDLVTGGGLLALPAGVVHDLGEADTVLGQWADDEAASGEIAHWLGLQRARRRDRVRRALAELADMAEAARDWGDALGHAQELLALDPRSEESHRRVMRLHYLAGDRAAALLAFDRCERTLKDEVGTRPSPDTLALLRVLERANTPTPAPASAVQAALLRPPRLVGRAAAWQALLEAGEAHHVAVVEAEAGMGKSRLVGDFARRLPHASLTLGARPGDAPVPHACTARLVRTLVQRHGEPPPTLRRTLARLLPEWGESHGSGDDPREATRLHAAMASLLQRAAESGTSLVVVDDLHFADPASAETLCALAGSETALQWIFALRPGEGSAAALEGVQRLLDSGRARRIVLAPLGHGEIAELVDSLDVPGWSGAAMAPRLARQTGGNPLFLLETLKTLPLDASAATVGPWPALSSVTELVGRRLGRLSAEAVRIARCAALAGEDFSVELATHLLGAGPLDLADAWAELEAAHVLHEQSFAHDLIRDAARASVPAPLARQLHAQIAQYLESHGGAPQRIAAHWQASAQPQRAVPHLIQAGHEAIKALRRAEAAQCFLDASAWQERAGDRHAAFETLNAYFAGGRAPPDGLQQRMIERLHSLAETPLQHAMAAERRSGLLSQAGEFARAGEVAEAALAGFRHEEAPALAAALMAKTMGALVQRGETEAAVRVMYRATALAEMSGDDETKQAAVSTLSSALSWAGRYGESEQHKVRALELARRIGRPLEILDSMIELAAAHRAIGRMAQARAAIEQAEQLARSHDIDIDDHFPWLGCDRVRVSIALGDYTAAVRQIDDAARRLSELMPSWRIAADNIATPMWMMLGQWARARRSADEALARCEGAVPMYAAQARCMALEVDLALHPVPDALAHIEDALARLGSKSPRAAQQLRLLRCRLLDPEAALDTARGVADEARVHGVLGVVLDAELAACTAARRAGQTGPAAAHAREALALFAQVEPAAAYRARVWLEAALALEPVDAAEHRRLLAVAAQWVRDSAAQRVPDEFRESFLQRNPVNRELLRLHGRAAR